MEYQFYIKCIVQKSYLTPTKSKIMKKIIFAIAFMSVAHLGFAQNDAFKKDVKKLIEVSGGGQEQQVKLIEQQLAPYVSKEKLPVIMKDITVEMDKLNEKIIDVYAKYYTPEDVKELLAFYNTPLGKKLTSKTQEITPEVVKVSTEFQTSVQGVVLKHMQ